MNFRNWFAVMVVLLIVGLWVGDKYLPIPVSEQVVGATILAFGLIIQFFFRKAGGSTPP